MLRKCEPLDSPGRTGEICGDVVQVPDDVLTSLLTRFDGLEAQILSQQAEIQILKRKQSFHNPVHVGFWLFPKLPIEIREMIWKCCSNLPHLISVHLIQKLKPNPLFGVTNLLGEMIEWQKFITQHFIEVINQNQSIQKVCRESYYSVHSRKSLMTQYDSTYHIIWTSSRIGFDYSHPVRYILEQLPPGLKYDTIAMSYDAWLYNLSTPFWSWDHDMKGGEKALLSTCHIYGIKNIILVVGDVSIRQRQDLKFISQRLAPRTLVRLSEWVNEDFYGDIDPEFSKMVVSDSMEDWQKLEEHSANELLKKICKMTETRKQKLLGVFARLSEYTLHKG